MNSPASQPPESRAREACKAVARGLALVGVLPLLLCYRLSALAIGRDRALEGATEALALLPGLPGRYLRRAFLARALDGGCHPTATVGFGALFSAAGAGVGARVYVGPRCHIGLATLEDDVLLAAGVHVPSGGHIHEFADPSVPIREQPGQRARVTGGGGAWGGSAAVVRADVGRGAVVGAGAVVTKPLPDGVIAAGVPARVLRSRQEASSGGVARDTVGG